MVPCTCIVIACDMHTRIAVVSAVNVYTWGRNSNMTLGHDHSKNHPEKLDLPQGHTVVQVRGQQFIQQCVCTFIAIRALL